MCIYQANSTNASIDIGLASDWLPSLKSVDNQIGAFSNVFEGQVLSSSLIVGVNFLYFVDGSCL